MVYTVLQYYKFDNLQNLFVRTRVQWFVETYQISNQFEFRISCKGPLRIPPHTHIQKHQHRNPPHSKRLPSPADDSAKSTLIVVSQDPKEKFV